MHKKTIAFPWSWLRQTAATTELVNYYGDVFLLLLAITAIGEELSRSRGGSAPLLSLCCRPNNTESVGRDFRVFSPSSWNSPVKLFPQEIYSQPFCRLITQSWSRKVSHGKYGGVNSHTC